MAAAHGTGKDDEVLPTIEQSLEDMPFVVPQMDSDSSESDEEEEAAEAAPEQAPEKFEGDFDWDGFSGAQKLSEQNAELVTQLDAKDKEIDELHVLMRAIEPIPGLDPEKFLDVMQGNEMVDQDYRDSKIVDLSKKLKNMKHEFDFKKNMLKYPAVPEILLPMKKETKAI